MMYLQCFFLLSVLILSVNGVRIEGGNRGVGGYGIPLSVEQRLQFFNPYSPDQPPAVSEDPEPENRLLDLGRPKLAGVQIENAVQLFRYRYPTPPTTPRPNSAAELYPLPPNFPSAFAAARPEPLPTTPRPQQIVQSDGSILITGNQVDDATAELIRQQADAIEQQRQSQLAAQQLQAAQERQQQFLDRRARIRQMIQLQQQEEALRQQIQQQQLLNGQLQIVQQPSDANVQPILTVQQPNQEIPIIQEIIQPQASSQRVASVPTGSYSSSQTYHVSKIQKKKK